MKISGRTGYPVGRGFEKIAAELGIDPKTLRQKFKKAGIMLESGMIPAEKVREIMNLLQVKQENLDGTEQIEQPD